IEVDVNPLVRFRSLTGQDPDAALAHQEAATPDVACLIPRVPSSLQRGRKLVCGKARAFFNFTWRSIEPGVASQIAAGYLLIYQLSKTAIGVVSENRNSSQNCGNHDRPELQTSPSLPPK